MVGLQASEGGGSSPVSGAKLQCRTWLRDTLIQILLMIALIPDTIWKATTPGGVNMRMCVPSRDCGESMVTLSKKCCSSVAVQAPQMEIPPTQMVLLFSFWETCQPCRNVYLLAVVSKCWSFFFFLIFTFSKCVGKCVSSLFIFPLDTTTCRRSGARVWPCGLAGDKFTF
jgi:hypothetical protein